jgi:glucose dehydrogenase
MHSITRAVRGRPRRSRAARRWVLLIGIALAATTAILAQRASHAQQPPPYSKWDQYGGSSDSMQYSSLGQINKSNIKQLARAWFYPVPGEADRLVFNPLIVDNVMYVTGVGGVLVALDAASGKELWLSTLRATERGLAYWES